MAKLSLLEIAQGVKRTDKRREGITPQEIELAIAWMEGEVSITQVSVAIKCKSTGQAYGRLAMILRQAYNEGVLKVITK